MPAKLDVGYGLNHQELIDQLDRTSLILQNQTISPAGSTGGTTTASSYKIANTVVYTSGGVFKSKTTAEVALTAGTHNVTANASSVQERCYHVYLNAAGTPTIVAGTQSTGIGTALFPDYAGTQAAPLTLIGGFRISIVAGGANFVAATTSLATAGNYTLTFYDFNTAPSYIGAAY